VGLGYYLNKEGRQSRANLNLRETIDPTSQPSTYNIYDNYKIDKILENERQMGATLTEQSNDPANTRIIPPYYNQLGAEKKRSSNQSHYGDKKKGKKLVLEKSPKLNLYNTDPVVRAYKQDKKEIGGFEENFMNVGYHNNMVPFFRGSQPKQNMRDSTNEGVLERFSGMGPNLFSKHEQNSLHKITKNPYVYGHPVESFDDRDRQGMNVSNKKQNELLIQPVYVGPDLSKEGRGGIKGNDGFHSMYRQREKTVDELRIKSKPKGVFDIHNHVTAPKHHVSQRPMDMEHRQYNAPREHEIGSYISAGPTSGSAHSTVRPNMDVPINQRDSTNKEYFGSVGNGLTTTRLDPEQFLLGSKNAHDRDWLGGAGGSEDKRGYMNNPNFIPDATIREQNHQEYSGVSSGNYKRHQGFNYNPERTTIKETTHSERTGVLGSDYKKHQDFHYNPERTTMKETTHGEYFAPVATGEHGSFKCREDEYNAEVNALKEFTQHHREPNQVREKLSIGADKINYQTFSARPQLESELYKRQDDIKHVGGQSIHNTTRRCLPTNKRILNKRNQEYNRIDDSMLEQLENHEFAIDKFHK